MNKRDAVRIARRYFGASVMAQGSETGTGYAHRCYLMRRKPVRTTVYETIGVGRTWEGALRDSLTAALIEKESCHVQAQE